MPIKSLADIEKYLELHSLPQKNNFPGGFGLKRTKHFLALLGNPQDKIKIIHIAGTSGKGSTAMLISHALVSQGFKTGSHLSPHISDIRERLQINNALPDEKIIVKYFNDILPIIEQMNLSKFSRPTYFEILVSLAFYIFHKENVDYAIMETGLGGLYDATNCINTDNKIVILTKIGLDHTNILGKCIADIAFQKASIIHSHNPVISAWQHHSARTVIEKIADQNKTNIDWIRPGKNFILHSQSPYQIVFTVKLQHLIKKIKLGVAGIYQAENCTLALACLFLCSQRDKFTLNEPALREAFANISLIARMDLLDVGEKTILLDGAHNPQKMAALTKSLRRMYPTQKLSFLLAFKTGKEYRGMLEKIIPIADRIFLTSFSLGTQENYPKSTDNSEIINFLNRKKFINYSVVANSQESILAAIKESKSIFVVTGSFYLISSLYPFLKDKK